MGKGDDGMIGYREPRVFDPYLFIAALLLWAFLSLVVSACCTGDEPAESTNQVERFVTYSKDRRTGICFAMYTSCDTCTIEALTAVDCKAAGLEEE